MTNSTLNYYNNSAPDFIQSTINADVSESIDKFMSQLPKGATVLDVGCGSGRDTMTFIQHGFKVVAFDAAEEIARLASEQINHPVLIKKIEDMTWDKEFDGVWAMASLLHLEKSKMKDALENCFNALKPNGVFFAAFKEGMGEGYDDKGRFFSYYQAEELKTLYSSIDQCEQAVVLNSSDSLGRTTKWVSIIAQKSLQPESQLKIKIK